jgi:NAD/NADP transhydrogenase beta subunit
MKPQNTIEKVALLIAIIYGAVTFGGAVVILLNL